MASYRDRVLLQVSCAIAALGLLLTTGDDEIPRPRRRRARTVARCFELQQMREYADLMIRNMRLGDGVRFFGFFRMSSMEFEFLLNTVAPALMTKKGKFL